ncbi:glycine cleavage system protein GcvH [candidate division WOR-3 bacterium]|uniref:Glycine cleavage system H protein n=1 Tax=candidate division WOR-3 bacterium TaxID=2052148 RepID=A0A660SF75_UNCW3|nr:MAG: glycine cleavage system protein GcvH [candidate division WOR-3 bacterium]
MVKIPEDLKYTKDHEWIRVEGDVAVEGITDYAQSELSDIVMVELPEVGRVVKLGESIGVIEAVKAVADLYAAVSGEVVAVNEKIVATPQLINQDPYGEGWMVKIRMSNPSELDTILSSEDYQQLIGEKE